MPGLGLCPRATPVPANRLRIGLHELLMAPSDYLRRALDERVDPQYAEMGLVAGLGLTAGFSFFALLDNPVYLPLAVLLGGAWGYVIGRVLAHLRSAIDNRYIGD